MILLNIAWGLAYRQMPVALCLAGVLMGQALYLR